MTARARGAVALAATLALSGALAAAAVGAERALTPRETLAHLRWLTGTWAADGFEATYTRAESGSILSVSRTFRDGRTTFFEFEHFAATDSGVTLTPYPGGRASVSFRLTHYDPAGRLAVFENPAHDFPRRLAYRRVGRDSLHIDLEGEENGARREARFRLRARR